MAVYKIPQDVEAEDKLIGPFGFRQFVYLMIAGFCIFLGFLFFRIYPLLAFIPLPVIGFFILLALPLRKDQPMEIYLLALVRFYSKPRRRLWNPDGTVTYIEITAPKVKEELPTKGLSSEAAEQRLDYLARIMDSRGWAIKGVTPSSSESVNATVAAEASSITDIMDNDAVVARSFDELLSKKQEQNRQNALSRMKQTAPAQQPPQPRGPRFAHNPYEEVLEDGRKAQPQPVHVATANSDALAEVISHAGAPQAGQQGAQPTTSTLEATAPTQSSNPYAALLQQPPAGTAPQNPATQPQNSAQNSSNQPVSPDIMRLAGNTDLSISAIANEAHRIEENKDGEVFIQLR